MKGYIVHQSIEHLKLWFSETSDSFLQPTIFELWKFFDNWLCQLLSKNSDMSWHTWYTDQNHTISGLGKIVRKSNYDIQTWFVQFTNQISQLKSNYELKLTLINISLQKTSNINTAHKFKLVWNKKHSLQTRKGAE